MYGEIPPLLPHTVTTQRKNVLFFMVSLFCINYILTHPPLFAFCIIFLLIACCKTKNQFCKIFWEKFERFYHKQYFSCANSILTIICKQMVHWKIIKLGKLTLGHLNEASKMVTYASGCWFWIYNFWSRERSKQQTYRLRRGRKNAVIAYVFI